MGISARSSLRRNITARSIGAAVDVSVDNVWITGCTTVSIRPGKSLNMLSSLLPSVSSACTDINSSSVSTSDSAYAVPSLCISLVVAGGSLEVSGAYLSSAVSSSEVNCHLRGLPLSALTSNDSHCQGINKSLKRGWEDEEASGAWEDEEERAGIPKGAEVGVGEVSVGAALLLSTSSRVNSASIHRMSMEDEGMTSISFAGSRGTPTRRHNSVIKTGNDKEICLCLALMAISYFLGWHESVVDEAKPEPGGDVHVPLFNRSSCIHPPRGGVRNHRSQLTLQVIQGLNNRQPL
ncbi:hypothetical protein H5410_056248, partial [Solanum commersonii]